MPADRFIDLDELVLECRTATAKRYVAEAVVCYRAGGFRACIVMTWIAVVYDIIDKLRELDLSGDQNAHEKITQFDKIQHDGDLRAALQFERNLLDLAKGEFELLSEVEHTALARLQDDRNRCAHPAFFSPGEVYSPSPELARTHLRSAIEYLLRHAPMQGKAALERLLKEISSEYFPDNKDEALKVLGAGPLARARPALTKNFVTVLLKELLKGDLERPAHTRRSAAMRAAIEMHREIAEAVFSEKLNTLISGLDDRQLIKAVATAYRVPEVRPFIAESAKLKLTNYVAGVEDDLFVAMFSGVVEIDFLREPGLARLGALPRAAVAKLGAQAPPARVAELIARVVEFYRSSGNFEQANSMGIAVSNLAVHFDANRAAETLRAATNNQVRFSTGLRGVIEAVRKTAVLSPLAFNRLLTEAEVNEVHLDLLYPPETATLEKQSSGSTTAAEKTPATQSKGLEANSPFGSSS